ncbi:MAG: LPS export ABC transporter permease LptG [Betaproteobacteria bacterium]|nr:LPS export ABC transporter permease LptG [Betaproteobacteria bacterium]
MRTFRRYLAREIYAATLFVFIAFLALFAFFDLIHELGDLGSGGYRLQHALTYVVLSLPSHVYELFPIAVLIGTLYVLSHLAANSEYTVMRSSGLSPGAAAGALLRIGAIFVVLTFLVGEFVAPASERAAKQLKLRATSSTVVQEFRTGLWVKDDRRFVNVRQVLPDTTLADVHIYEFDDDYRLVSVSAAERGEYADRGIWRLANVWLTRFSRSEARVQRLAEIEWRSVLTPDILSVLFVAPERMSAWNLYQYTRHLAENRQKTERYEIAMWKKLLYPFGALVMMALALPFAYIHTRSGSVGSKVFSGIMLGIFFHMLNSLFSYLGILQSWQPAFSAFLPSLVFLLTAALMMWWVERR